MMKKLFSKLTGIGLAFLIVFSTVSCFVSAAGSFTLDGQVLSNEYIALSVSSEGMDYPGRYTIGTTGGNPLISSDDYQKLLYGYPGNWSTYTTMVVDGSVYKYGIDGFSQAPAFNVTEGSNVSAVEYGSGAVRVTQTLQIIKNNSTDREDVVEIKYEVTNMDSVAHTVGSRIMLDTMLADNDFAPFRVQGIGDITTQTEFSGSSIPQYWQAFDSLTDPTTIGQGSFLRTANIPDAVQFTSWEVVYEQPWNCPVTPGVENGDSAVCVIWNEKPLSAGETRTYKTHYGLSELVENTNGELSLSLYGDSTVNIENGQYMPNPISATAYVKNIGNANTENTYISISTSGPLTVDGGTYKRVELGTLTPGQEVQVSWDLLVAAVATETVVPIIVTLGADGLEEISSTRDITVPPIEETTTYQITFDAAGGTGGVVRTVAEGQMPTAPVVTKEGFTFVEWTPAIVPATADATYTAVWQIIPPVTDPTIMITFEENDIGLLKRVVVPYGTCYKNVSMQLGYQTNVENPARIEWISTNENLMIDQNGLITNKCIACRSSMITVNLYDESDTIIATDSVKIVFTRPLWQFFYNIFSAIRLHFAEL